MSASKSMQMGGVVRTHVGHAAGHAVLVSIPHVSGKILMCLGGDENGELKFALANDTDDLRMKARLCGYTHAPAPFAEWTTKTPEYGMTELTENLP